MRVQSLASRLALLAHGGHTTRHSLQAALFAAVAVALSARPQCNAESAHAAAAKECAGGERPAAAPTSNKSTAKWRVYTDVGRDLVNQARASTA